MGSEYVAWLSSQPETFSCEYLAGYLKYLEMILRKEDGKITLWECSPSRGLDVGWRHVGRETMKKKAKQMMQDCNATWLQHAHAQFFLTRQALRLLHIYRVLLLSGAQLGRPPGDATPTGRFWPILFGLCDGT